VLDYLLVILAKAPIVYETTGRSSSSAAIKTDSTLVRPDAKDDTYEVANAA